MKLYINSDIELNKEACFLEFVDNLAGKVAILRVSDGEIGGFNYTINIDDDEILKCPVDQLILEYREKSESIDGDIVTYPELHKFGEYKILNMEDRLYYAKRLGQKSFILMADGLVYSLIDRTLLNRMVRR